MVEEKLLLLKSATERRCMCKSYYSQTQHTECVSMTGKDHLIDVNKIIFALVSQEMLSTFEMGVKICYYSVLVGSALRVRCVTRRIKQFLWVVSPEKAPMEKWKREAGRKAV